MLMFAELTFNANVAKMFVLNIFSVFHNSNHVHLAFQRVKIGFLSPVHSLVSVWVSVLPIMAVDS